MGEQGKQLLDSATDTRMGFCGGAALLCIDVSVFLSGMDVAAVREAMWIAATAAVLRGVLWVAFKLAGVRPPKSLTKETDNGG